ncbi:PKD domain-containing protein [Natronosalvus halobius]|uniref:PKD domain-containing protein n=1 Tax=Natronosalvus halobius TaxID=2953746 RepID=UPI0020A1A8DB|nr:PKD domain-containing protein [Natronosalvus halobius]USZ73486.1 PKD domain-containing protein [Natronosalvus halobius]
MHRRTFLTRLGIAGGAALSGTAITAAETSDGRETIQPLAFDSTASILNAEGEPLIDDSLVAVWAESTAYNGDEDGNGDAVSYPEETSIPLVATTGTLVGFGAPMAQNDADFNAGNEEFLLNVLDAKLDGEGIVLWDEGHGQFHELTLSNHSSFEQYAENAGYDLQATTDLLGGASLTFPSTASQVAPDGGALTDPSTVMVRAEPTAANVDNAGDAASYIYGDDEEIPLVSTDGDVVGFGTPELIADGELDGTNNEFALSLLTETIDDGGTVLWDDAHDTYYNSSRFASFADIVESEGYEFEATTESLVAGSGENPDTDGGVLSADPATAGEPSVHTWTLEDVSFGKSGADGDEVDTITVAYESASLDGLSQDDVTVTMTRTLSGGADESEISVNQGSYGGSSATFDLSGRYQTDVAGPVVVEIDGVENPTASEVATITLAGDAEPVTVEADLAVGDESSAPTGPAIDELEFFSTASLVSADETPLIDDSVVAVWAESTAENVDEGGDGLVSYPADVDIPLVAADGGVVGIGADLATDDSDLDANREFLVNAWTDRLGESGSVVFDESHGQALSLSDYSELVSHAEGRGFDVTASGDLAADLSEADLAMVTTPGEPFSSADLDALSEFVDSGGVIFVHDEADYGGHSTAELNEITAALEAEFRFNSDQVVDEEHSTWAPFVLRTTNFNDSFGFFGSDGSDPGAGDSPLEGVDLLAIPSPAEPYTDAELAAVTDHIADGGNVFLFDESEFTNEETANLNAIAESLDLSFRFNADQVEDQENNAGAPYVPTTSNVNEAFSVFDGLGSPALSDADGLVVASPTVAFSGAELDSLSSFVDSGGAVFLFDQSDYGDYDETANLNEIATAIDAPFRFNDDQVYDDQNNAYADFVPTTENFNDNFEYFHEREGLGLELDRDETYQVEIVSVTDGDTIDVAFEDGRERSIRTLGFDTPETGSATSTERAEEWEGIDSYSYLEAAGEAATAFAQGELSPGDTVDLTFDAIEPVRDQYGRILGYLTYDASGDGSRDTLYNRRVVEAGHARVYGSGFARHDEFLAAEFAARDAGLAVWSESDPFASSPIRDRPVEELFFPNPAAIVTESGPLASNRVPAFAAPTAGRSGVETTYEGDVPLAGVDYDARLAYLGAPIVDETYEAAEGYPVDTSGYDNFAFVTELVNDLSDREDGPILIEGGHGQFNLGYSLSNEDAAYYQRYLEGQGILFEQVNDVTTAASADRLADARALVVTTPATAFTEDELAAVASFAVAGGTVVLMGSANAPAAQREYLDDIAAGIGSDLRLGAGSVTDTESNLNDEPSIPVTTNLNETETPPDEPPIARINPDTTEVTIGERLSFGVEDTSGNERWIDSLEWDLGDGTTATGWWTDHRYDDPGEYTVTLTATDNTGTETTDTITVTVEDLTEPIARLAPSTTDASVDERVTFQVEDTSGNERWIDSLAWSFGDGTTAEGWWNAHRYDEPGEYTVTLTATDNTGAKTTDTVTIAVE